MARLVIDHLGRQGDGISFVDGNPVYVPLSLEGETVTVTDSGKKRPLGEILVRSEDRVEPVCAHFGECGGCQVQHLIENKYNEWKQNIVAHALQKAGINHSIDRLVTFDVDSRRKCVFRASNTIKGTQLGYAGQSGSEIVSIEQCPVLVPAIENQIRYLRDLISSLPQRKKPFRLSVLATKNGLDLGLEGDAPIANDIRDVLIRKAILHGFARLSYDGEVLIEQQKPALDMGIAQVSPPPSAFVQAVEEAEQEMCELVCSHLSDCKAVVDLFCGTGTFTLRLAQRSTVWALEENQAAIDTLGRAWRETGGKLKQIKPEVRNLDRRPVNFQELKKFDGLVFDPPRAGAEVQVKQIAKSMVARVAAVSCNPTTLSRDLDILIDGGYRISRIVPIDQFRFTPHVEVVALLER